MFAVIDISNRIVSLHATRFEAQDDADRRNMASDANSYRVAEL